MARLLETVRQKNIKRLFLDGVDGFVELAVEPERVKPLFTALANELRALNVTLLYTHEDDVCVTGGVLPLTGMHLRGASGIAETIILMRYAELRSELHRFVGVLKARNSHIARTLRRFEMTDQGIVVEPDNAGAEGVLEALQSGLQPQRGD